MNYRKPSFSMVVLSIIALIIVGIALVTNPMQWNTIQLENIISDRSSGVPEAANTTDYDTVKIEFISDMDGFKSTEEFETTDSKIVAFIDSTIRTSQRHIEEDDLDNNHTNQYRIKLSNDIGGYNCRLYYDTLYDKGYLEKDGGLYEASTDFARYIDSFLENTNITATIDDTDAVALFQTYGWKLDYQINTIKVKLNDISVLSGFNPEAYFFAYNNELSKDIGLDMRGYSNTNGQTLYEWLSQMIKADRTEKRLSKLEPEQVIEEYFMALDNKDAKTAAYFISKKSLLENLTSNMPNGQLFNEAIGLPLNDANIGASSSFDNLKSAKLLRAELIDGSDKHIRSYRVTVNLQYNEELSVSSGEQFWDCRVVYESSQTGWKIEGFGH